jgi:type IV secretory pathway component VirB8
MRRKKEKPMLGYFSGSESLLEKQIRILRTRVKRYQWLILCCSFSICILSMGLFWCLVWRGQDLVVLHESVDGLSWITQRQKSLKPNEAATRANLANYVRLRESYAAESFPYQYRQVIQQSSLSVTLPFRQESSVNNKNSLMQQLGREGVRNIKIDDIVLLPFSPSLDKNQPNLKRPFAEVHFTAIDVNSLTKIPTVKSHRALIAWTYEGLPESPEERLTNWMGFRVTYYKVED